MTNERLEEDKCMSDVENLKANAQTFVRETMESSGKKPSERAVKKAANKIVQALKPTLASLKEAE
jgi:hypothetical protein